MFFTCTITRPANTTPAYDIGDVIGNADVSVAANAGSAVLLLSPGTGVLSNECIITGYALKIGVTAVPATMTTFRMHLYYGAPDARLDKEAWIKTSANDKAVYLGYVDMGTPAVVGGDLWIETLGVNKQIRLPNGPGSLYGELVTNGTYTGASACVYEIVLYAIPVTN